MVFTHHEQEARRHMMLHVRTTNDPHSYSQSVREIVQKLDQDIFLYGIETIAEGKADNNSQWIVVSLILFSFGAAALVMATTGVYSVVAQSTANRKQELGIRKALGATARNIQGVTLSAGLIQLTIGLFIGASISLAITHFLKDLLGPLMPYSSTAYFTVILFLLAIGLLACWLPARKAAFVNPVETLRAE